jgi:hypothetical protein
MLHYNTLITLQLQQLLPQLQLQLQPHHITLHCTNYIAARYNYKYKCDCNHITLHYTALHHTNYITLRYGNDIYGGRARPRGPGGSMKYRFVYLNSMAGRAKENFPGGSLKYLFVYF